MFSVADKIVCITGSSRGLGKSLARRFAENGSKVIISSFNSEELKYAKNELASDKLAVEAVAPGYIENIMTGVRYDENDPYQKRVIDFTPMGRRGRMEEFLGAYIFLASEAASFVTGEVIYVDGGYHAT